VYWITAPSVAQIQLHSLQKQKKKSLTFSKNGPSMKFDNLYIHSAHQGLTEMRHEGFVLSNFVANSNQKEPNILGRQMSVLGLVVQGVWATYDTQRSQPPHNKL
jgi:hypothetical protein